jgi:hypothetical protein
MIEAGPIYLTRSGSLARWNSFSAPAKRAVPKISLLNWRINRSLRQVNQNELAKCFLRSMLNDSRTLGCGACEPRAGTPTYSPVSQFSSIVMRM